MLTTEKCVEAGTGEAVATAVTTFAHKPGAAFVLQCAQLPTARPRPVPGPAPHQELEAASLHLAASMPLPRAFAACAALPP